VKTKAGTPVGIRASRQTRAVPKDEAVGQSGSGDEAPDATTQDETRDVVAQASGFLVAQFGISPETAFDKLTAEAADSGRPVGDVAREIVRNGGL